MKKLLQVTQARKWDGHPGKYRSIFSGVIKSFQYGLEREDFLFLIFFFLDLIKRELGDK